MAGVWVELLKANGGKRAVVASVRVIRLICAVCEGGSEKLRGRLSGIAKQIHI